MKSKQDIDWKIISAIERICNAVRALIWDKVKETNLSPIQLHFLLYLKKYPESMRTVSNISAEFRLTKATVCDSLNSLERKKLIWKEKNPMDRRFSVISLTKKGEKFVNNLQLMNEPLKKILESFPEKEKEKIFTFFIKLIDSLRREGVIKVARICISCSHFKRNHKSYLCELTGKKFTLQEINIDCIYHNPINS